MMTVNGTEQPTFSMDSGVEEVEFGDLEHNPNYEHSDEDLAMSSLQYPPLLVSTGFAVEYIIPVVFAFIFVIGLVGNGTLIYIVMKNRSLRNTPNIFIVSLATADLLLVLVSVPFSATVFTFNYWPYGTVMCKVNYFMQTLSLGVSVFTLVALSGDRYMAIVHPMSSHLSSTGLRTGLCAAGIWLLSAALAVMDIVRTEVIFVRVDNTTHKPICVVQSNEPSDPYARFRTMFRFTVYFAVPVLIICSFYIMMARILTQSSSAVLGDSSCTQVSRQLDARKKVAKVVLSFVVVFIICWLPYYMYRIWYYFLPGEFNLFWLIFKFLSFCLAFLNSCVNPFALYFLSKVFRAYYNRYLFCCCPCVNTTQNGEYTSTGYQLKKHSNVRRNNGVTFATSHSAI